jgi:hypothetical protein
MVCLLMLAGSAHAAKKPAKKKPEAPLPTEPTVILADMTNSALKLRERALEGFKALPEAKQAEMIPGLLKLTTATDRLAWFGQSSACKALKHMGTRAAAAGPELQKNLITLLPGSDRPTVALLINTAVAVDAKTDETLLPKLSPFLQGKDIRAKQLALHALATRAKSESITPAMVNALIAMCKDEAAEQRLRVEAIQTLGKLQAGRATAVPAAVALLKDPDASVQDAALACLQKMGAAAAPAVKDMQALADALNNKRRNKTATNRDVAQGNQIAAAIRNIQAAAKKAAKKKEL